MQADSNDTLRSMTVIPYIEDLHRGMPSDDEEEYEEDQIIQTALPLDGPVGGNGTQNHTHSEYRLNVTTCIQPYLL